MEATLFLSRKEEILAQILSVYTNLTKEQLLKLIDKTNEVSGVSYVGIKGYSSDKSENTELANHLINIGVLYANQKKSDAIKYDALKPADIAEIMKLADKWNLSGINLAKLGMSENQYRNDVKLAIPNAIIELQMPSKPRVSNDIWINKALVWNTNTERLSIYGQGEVKTVTEKGEFKLVASAPLTVAKDVVKKYCESKTAKIRRFTLDNLISGVNLKGETIEIE